MLAPFGVAVRAPWSGSGEIVEETGSSYVDNARLKARAIAEQDQVWALGDDSGIEVDALGGQPGIFSARFVSSDPWENCREILLRLMEVQTSRRTAKMVAALVLCGPQGQELVTSGEVRGSILSWPRGHHGFGVDPIFSLDGIRSLAEMTDVEKDAISHRGRAVRRLWETLDCATW